MPRRGQAQKRKERESRVVKDARIQANKEAIETFETVVAPTIGVVTLTVLAFVVYWTW